MAYKPTYINASSPTAPADYKADSYNSKYRKKLSKALNNVIGWKYDPMKDASYQALAKVYGARGNQAAKDTLGDAAALNGGYGTSYAVSAAQQARNQYNQELAGLIPDLEANAYNKATTALGALRDADDTAYGRYRDRVGDKQWLYGQNYQKYQDALAQYQWAQNWNMDLYQYEQAQANKGGSGGGGGGRRSYGGGGGGYTSTSTSDEDMLRSLFNDASSDDSKKKKKTVSGGSGKMTMMTK